MNEFEYTEESLFEKCLELPQEERAAFVEGECVAQPELKGAVLQLLRSHQRAGGFLETLPRHDTEKVKARLERIAPAEESSGDQIGRYRLRELIGEGA